MEDLEALLISSDLGVKMTSSIMDFLNQEVRNGASIDQKSLISIIKRRLMEVLYSEQLGAISIKDIKNELSLQDVPVVVMIVGVNGVGKTTTVAKLAAKFKKQDAKVILAAADTFRAAAVEQLRMWGEKLGISVVSGSQQSKPATVVFDAIIAAKREKADVLIIDTAGRLHTKTNLMQELSGVNNIIARHLPGAPHETILVIDGSSGQNALSQAGQFQSAIPLTGLIVTKLDGTSKGGIVAAIKEEMNIPIRYIGVGESEEDLQEFDSADFVDALLDQSAVVGSSVAERPLSHHGEVRRRRQDN